MFFKVKDSRTPIRELNHKVSRYKKWWRDQRDANSSSVQKQKKSSFTESGMIDDSFVYYEEK